MKRPSSISKLLPKSQTDSATPWSTGDIRAGVLLLGVLLAYILVYTSLPKLLAQVYGGSAVNSIDLSWPLAFIAFLASNKAELNNINTVSALMAGTSSLWALFLRFGKLYFRYDTVVLAKLLSYAGLLFSMSAASQSIHGLEVYVPIVASTVVRIFFEFSALVLLGSITNLFSRAKSTATRGTMFLALVSITRALKFESWAKAQYIYYAVLALLLCSLSTVRLNRSTLPRLSFLLVVIWCLFTTETLSCGALPGILQCPRKVGNFDVLSSVESLTGRITVVQNEKYRLLVADHSLLGGEWKGVGPNESIFITFYMQAMAIYAIQKKREAISVLQIGLGIGTATKTILDQPIFKDGHIDVVEIDAQVLENAHVFFDLPRPERDSRLMTHAVDALDFLKTAKVNSYDLISHDIFTGGSLTFQLFTKQFFERVKKSLKTDGVLTVNYVYAPKIAQTSFEAVMNTLRSVFSFVAVFVESGKLNSISNVVIFASDRPIYLDIPDSGQEPVTNLGKTAREMKSWEFAELASLSYDASQILHDPTIDGGQSRQKIKKTDLLMAMHHWAFMRQLLPEPENELWFAY